MTEHEWFEFTSYILIMFILVIAALGMIVTQLTNWREEWKKKNDKS